MKIKDAEIGPITFAFLKQLEELSIYGCPQFELLPYSIGYLSSLRSLILADASKITI